MPSGLLQRVCPCPSVLTWAQCLSLYVSLFVSDSTLGEYVNSFLIYEFSFMSSDLKWMLSQNIPM